MNLKQQTFEAMLGQLLKTSSKEAIFDFISNTGVKKSVFQYPNRHIIELLGKFDMSADDKIHMLNEIERLYTLDIPDKFKGVVLVSLLHNCDVTPRFVRLYGYMDERIQNEEILSYLYQINRLDLIDVLIDKYRKNIRSYVKHLEMYQKNIDPLTIYVQENWIKPQQIHVNKKVKHIELVRQYAHSYVLLQENLLEVKINDLSIEDFLNTNEDYIYKSIICQPNPDDFKV